MPTRGVERWLAHRLGATARRQPGPLRRRVRQRRVPVPRASGRRRALAVATGVDRDERPVATRARSSGRCSTVLDARLERAVAAVVATHLGAGPGEEADDHDALRRRRRHPAARHIAELFDRYGVYRPSMVLAWARPATTPTAPAIPTCRPTPAGRPSCCAGCGTTSASPRPAGAARRCVRPAAGRHRGLTVDLPERVSLFGLTRLPASYLQVLRALAAQRDVHLYASTLARPVGPHRRSHRTPSRRRAACPGRGPDPPGPRNPLLATWGHDSREMQLVLPAAAEADVAHRPATPLRPIPTAAGPPAARIRDDDPVRPPARCRRRVRRPLGAGARLPRPGPPGRGRCATPSATCWPPTRRSSRATSSCCAPTSTSTPRSCTPPSAPATPTTTRDRCRAAGAPRTASPIARCARPTRSSARWPTCSTCSTTGSPPPRSLAFAGRPPVRRRFGFDDDDLERIAGWVEATGVRWGLDAEHRAPCRLHAVGAEHLAGRPRPGPARRGDGRGRRTAPSAGGSRSTTSTAATSTSPAASPSWSTASARSSSDCCDDRPVAEWVALLGEAADLLLATAADRRLAARAGRPLLRDLLAESSSAGTPNDRPLSLAEVRGAARRPAARGMPDPGRLPHRRLTMCTLVPMRAVPHRVVCILGLDDGVFPRTARVDGDDLLQRVPLVGDRDPRSRGPPAAARRACSPPRSTLVAHLHRPRRAHERGAPAVGAVDELLDVVDPPPPSTVAAPRRRDPPPAPAVRPRRRFDERRAPWSFDPVQLAGARARWPAPASRRPPFLPAPLAPRDGDVGRPRRPGALRAAPGCAAFLRQRLGVSTWEDDDQLPDASRSSSTTCSAWGVGQRILRQLLAGVDLDAAVRAEIAARHPPAGRAAPPVAQGRGQRRRRHPPAGRGPGRRRAADVGRGRRRCRPVRGRRRPGADPRHGAGRARPHGGRGLVLVAQPEDPARPLGPPPRRQRRATGAGLVHGRHRQVPPRRQARPPPRAGRTARAPGGRGRPAPRPARRPPPARPARAPTAPLQDRRGLGLRRAPASRSHGRRPRAAGPATATAATPTKPARCASTARASRSTQLVDAGLPDLATHLWGPVLVRESWR